MGEFDDARERLGARRRLAAALFLCAGLAACGSEPSEGEMRAAVDRQVADQAKALEAFVGKSQASKGLAPEIKSLRKIGCKPDGEKAYACDVEVEVSHLGSTIKAVRPVRFVKGGEGWAVAG